MHTPSSGVAPATTVRKALLAGVAIELAAVYAPTARWLLGRWTASVWQDAHGLLIAAAVAYFIYDELGRRRDLPAGASGWGFAFLVPALALRALDAGMHTELVSAVSLVLLLPGVSLLFLGVARTRAIAFPLAFALFVLPIPLALTEPINMVLRAIAARSAATLVQLIGIPVLLDRTTLHLPNASLLVGDACSGFSTAYAAVAVALLTAYSTTTNRRGATPLLAALPLAIAANALRVALLALLVYRQGTDVLDTSLHPLSGLLTFALVLPVIFWLGRRDASEAP